MSDDNNDLSSINYELLVEDALRSVVRGALSIVEHTDLPGDTHFYISFRTDFDGVQIADELRAANPTEMTIVLQHQFWDLKVEGDHFSVSLAFSGVSHTLVVPFAAITHFNDPSVGFGLQFSVDTEDEDTKANSVAADANSDAADTDSKAAERDETADIVSLDAFRKKPTPSA